MVYLSLDHLFFFRWKTLNSFAVFCHLIMPMNYWFSPKISLFRLLFDIILFLILDTVGAFLKFQNAFHTIVLQYKYYFAFIVYMILVSCWAYQMLSSLNFRLYKRRPSNTQLSSLCMIIGKKRYIIRLSLLRHMPPLFINLAFWMTFNNCLHLRSGNCTRAWYLLTFTWLNVDANGWRDVLRLLEYASDFTSIIKEGITIKCH